MRLFSVELGGTELTLHPLVTIVNGLDDARRDRLVEVLAALPAGRAAATGVIEAHGVLLDLTAENLELLELDSDIDVVVRRSELPGAELSPAARERGLVRARRDELLATIEQRRADGHRAAAAQSAAAEALADARGERSEAEVHAQREQRLEAPRLELERRAQVRRDLEALLEQTNLSLEPSRQATSDAARARDRAQDFRSEAAKACSMAAAELEAARAGRDPGAPSALEGARQRVADLESGLADAELADGPEDADTAGDPEDDTPLVDRLEARRTLLEASLIALDPVDPFPVEVALRRLQSDTGTDLVKSIEADDLANEWAELLSELGATQVSEHDAGQIQAARRRLEQARASLFAAEGAARLPDLDREQVDALENAHEAVLQAQDRSERRLTGDRAKRRVDEARAEEQAILDRLGMHTYADFVMGTSMLRIDPEQEQRLDDARDELARAEDALASLEAEVEGELRHAEVMGRRRGLRDRAIEVLGRDPGDDDMEWALRHHRVAVSDGGDRSLRLRVELENAGLGLGDEDVPPSMLVELATIWLEELGDTAAQRVAIENELAELATAIERAELAAGSDDDEDTAGVAELDGRRAAKLNEAHAAVAAAEVRLDRHHAAEEETERRRTALGRLTEIEQKAAVDLAAADEAWAAASELEHDAAHRLIAIEADLAAAAAAERAAASALESSAERDVQSRSGDNVDELAAAMAAASDKATTAEADVEALEAELASIETRLHELEDAVPSSSAAPTEGELEWYLLARLAAQRSVSYAGSVPLVLDEALRELTGAALVRVLERLERMSGAVQLIVLSDDPAASAWAKDAGPERALLLTG